MKVLFINNTPKECGVAQYGRSTFNLLATSKKLEMIYAPCDTYVDAAQYINKHQPEVVIYNYHTYTIPWADKQFVDRYPNIKHIAIEHEIVMPAPKNMTKKIPQATLPRALFACEDKYVDTSVPVIGSFGFGSFHKGFHNLILKIQDEFDEAIFRLHMPPSFYCDPQAAMSREVAAECARRITKPGIKLDVDYEFFSSDQLLEWLNSNTLNAFHYEPLPYDPGISSVIDWALSAKRPIAISGSPMFRHIANAVPSICMDEVSLCDIIKNGTKPLKPFYEEWSNKNFVKIWEDIIVHV